MVTVPCERCGRQVVDGSTSWGAFLLKPTCQGIEVVVGRDTICFVSRDELQTFLDKSYGPMAPVDEVARRRAYMALDAVDGKDWAGATRSAVVNLMIDALRAES